MVDFWYLMEFHTEKLLLVHSQLKLHNIGEHNHIKLSLKRKLKSEQAIMVRFLKPHLHNQLPTQKFITKQLRKTIHLLMHQLNVNVMKCH
jgi:hypothetical protein